MCIVFHPCTVRCLFVRLTCVGIVVLAYIKPISSIDVIFTLQESFDDLALFFHDTFGGSLIAVLWKPQALVPHDFKVC